MRLICDTPDRLLARLYRWQLAKANGCPCCAFWRGVVSGAAIPIALLVYRSLHG